MDVENQFNKLFRYFWVVWVLSAVLSLTFVGVMIWGIIELVQWVTTL